MTDDAYFLDVNVPMYAAGADHPNRATCVWVMTAVAHGVLNALIDAEIVQEIYHRYGALNQWAAADKIASSLLRLLPPVLPITHEDVAQMIGLARQYGPRDNLPARDLLHAAVMLNNGITTIISTDRHFDRIEGVVRLHPQEVMERYQQQDQ